MAMSVTEKALKDFEDDLQKVIDNFEKEYGMFVVDIEYDGFRKNIHYTFAGENFKFTKDNAY